MFFLFNPRTGSGTTARRRFTTLALSLFSASAVWLSPGSLFPASASAEPPQIPAPSVPSAPPVTLEDVRFVANDSSFPAGLFFGLPSVSVRLDNGRVELSERGTGTGTGIRINTPVALRPGETVFEVPSRAPVTPFWTGPLAEAQFVHEIKAGVDTLTDRSGTVIWSNAAELSPPDLLLERTEPGQATLKNKDGALLWSGSLPTLPTSSVGSSSTRTSSRGGTVYQFDSDGVHLRSVNTAFTLTDDEQRVLWSGTVRLQPVVLIRQGRRFSLLSPHRSATGSDRTTEISFGVENGTVTVEDTAGSVVGTRAIELMKVFQKTTSVNDEGQDKFGPNLFGQNLYPQYLLPRPTVKTGAGVTLLYKDSTGKLIERSTIGENKRLRRPVKSTGSTGT